MTDLTHQHLAQRLNRRAETERENARMDEIERAATPLFYIVFSVAAAMMLWILTADYRDMLQHRLDTMADAQQYQRMSAVLARCANGDAVGFDGAMLQCERIELVGGL